MLTTGRIYWTEALAYVPASHLAIPLGTHQTSSPRLALRWLRERAAHIADQLDAPDAAMVRHWLGDHQEHAHAMTLLVQGAGYTFTAFDDVTRYHLMTQGSGKVVW